MASHIPLLQRKALTARLFYLDSTRKDRSLGKVVQAVYDHLDQQLFALANLALDEPSPDSIRLDRFLCTLADDFESAARPLLRIANGAAVAPGSEEFKNRIQRFS